MAYTRSLGLTEVVREHRSRSDDPAVAGIERRTLDAICGCMTLPEFALLPRSPRPPGHTVG